MFFCYGLKDNFRPVMRNEKVFRKFEIKISTRICLENTLRAEVSLSHGFYRLRSRSRGFSVT